MAELKGDKEKPDGLEITSIGSLYTGPWDKKYWSSSRGKGRYPYPVGYEAVRAHNGSTYKMEIHEGPKGPMFIISTADGHSSSGQTPDIAWEKFQKKYCPHVKIWHGKRFSCNIDGVEFFGFKNSFVQRLLREIVANVSGTIEKNLLSSSFCKEGPKADHISSHPDAQTHHDLLSLDRSQIIGKRSRRLGIVNTKSSNNANLKRSRSQALANVTEASNIIEENQRIIATGSPLPSFKGKCDDNEQPTIVPRSVSHISESDLPLNLVDISNNLRNIVPSEETRLVVRSRNCASTNLAGKLLTEEKYLDRLQGIDVEDFISPMSLEVKNGEHPGLRDDQVANDVVLYVPDTLDFVQDDTADNGPSVQDKRESTAADMIISEGLVSESDPEEERGTSNSNGSSQKSDFDSVGQETAKSMMSFLLPQAVPLLKKSSRKKKAAVSPSEIMPFGENTPELNKKTNVSSPAVLVTENKMVDLKGQMNVQITNLHSADAENIVTLDNLRDQIYGEHASYHEILPSFDAKADQVRFNDEAYPCNARGQSTGIGEESDCFHENSESKDIFCYDEVHMDPSGMLHQGDVISKSMSSSTVPFNNDCAEEIRDACHSAGRLRSSNILPEESCVKNVVDNCSKTSTEVSRLVYSRRRKKVKAITRIKGKYNCPLSESIICSNVEDNHVSETCPSRNPIALETVEMGSSDEKSHTKDLSRVEPKVLGQSQNLHAERSTVNMISAVSQHQSFTSASKSKETIYFLDRSGSHVQKSHIHVDKELVGPKNLFLPSSFESSEELRIGISNRSPPTVKEYGCSSDGKPKNMATNKDLLGLGELVGCYLHPLPVLSLLVCTTGEDIHICVLCGLRVNKDRTLFIYKIATQEPRVGYPSFVGHTSVTLPTLKDYFGKEIALERSGLQYTPGGQYLVLLDSIRTPYCRQGTIPCLCPACASGSFEEDAVKIVKVKLGYVSVVVKLKTLESLQCVLVCEPNHLVAVGESGRLHLWVMNPAWSAQIEQFILPANDLVSPGIVELKRIPKCVRLVVGHNGFGEFSLWDISKRILVSKFSTSCTSFNEFFPVALFGWKKKGHSFGDCNVHGHVNRMMAATNMWFSEQTNDDSFPLLEEEIAVWLLVSVPSDSDDHHDYTSGDYHTKSVGWWRLALLVKNMVILGGALDPSAEAIGASAGHGIIGTCDGLVYMWEMSTGTKLGTLHHFRGSSVSCIATDDSKKDAVAISGGEGKGLPPGTMGWPVFGETTEFLKHGLDFLNNKKAMYGNVFKTHIFGSPTIICMDPDLNRYILLNEGKGLVPGYPQSMVNILGKSNIAAVYGSSHKHIRGSLLSLVGPPAIRDVLLPNIDKYMRLFLLNWDGKTIDIQIKTVEMAFFAFFKQILEGESSMIYESFKAEFRKILVGAFTLPINIPGTSYYQGMQGRRNIERLLRQIMEERRASGSQNDMLNRILRDEENNHNLIDEEIIDQIITILYSSFETVSTTSMMAIKYLHDNPRALQELREEHLAIRRRKKEEEPIIWDDYKKSISFTRVIFETSRLACVVCGMMRKMASDMDLNGFVFPKGWKVYLFTRETNFNPFLYPEPFTFNPWRWLQFEIQNKSLESHKYCLFFGGGSRLCPGKELGIVQISVFLHYFLTKYRWEEVGEHEILKFPRVEAPRGLHIKVFKY